ncbi:hypothetical protein ACLDXX_04585 [Acinetobacter baumannii]
MDLSGGSLTGAINEAASIAIASASTVDLTNATGNFVHITGTTSIATINLVQGASRRVVFDGILTLTSSASLILPGGANITTAVGDSAIFVGDASNIVRCVSYTRANGTSLVGTSINNTLTSTSTTQALSAAQGKALNDQAFGIGQTYQDVTASRAIGTTYTNSTGKTIFVLISYAATNSVDLTRITIGGLDVVGALEFGGSGTVVMLSFPVPNNTTYKFDAAYGSIQKWSEMR